MNRKGEVGIASLIIIIAIIIIGYVILMPPCDKCQLLDTDCPSYCENADEDDDILLSESPGRASDENRDEIIHELGSLNMFVSSEPEIKTLAGFLDVSHGLFGSAPKTMEFNIEDFDNVESATLNFFIVESSGDLMIELNGHNIHKGFLDGSEMIDLPSDFLREENRLKLYVSSPGFAFWKRNAYELRDVKLKKSYSVSHSDLAKSFYVSEDEKDELRESILEYSLYCRSPGGDEVRVYLNDELVYVEEANCYSGFKEVELSRDDILEGQNEISIYVGGGDYLFNDVAIVNKLKNAIDLTYEFDVDEDDHDSYLLEMELDDYVKAEVVINGHSFDVETNEDYYSKDITNYIKDGKNRIKIIPETEFEIDELTITGE